MSKFKEDCDESGELISISRWDEVDINLASRITRNNRMHDQYIDYVLDKFVPEDYKVSEVIEFTNDLEEIIYTRENSLNIKIPYDSYRFVFHPTENFVLL